ncbi:MAG: hypothetical protein RR327_03645 [Clostridia bacterium]
MTQKEIVELIHELIDVDTEDGFIVSSFANDNSITFLTKESDKFKLSFKKLN